MRQSRRLAVQAPVRSLHQERWFYLLVSPWLFGLLSFYLLPSLAAVGLSLSEWYLTLPPEWTGLSNYRRLLQDELVWRSLSNTFIYAAGIVLPGLAIGLLLAVLLKRRGPGVAYFRMVVFSPVLVSGVATTLLWGWIFNPRFGLINELIALFGLRGPAWLQDPHWAMPAVILIGLWSSGINMLVYLAALQNIPAELLDAAALDGAGSWRTFWSVTFPLLMPASFYLLVANTIGALQVFTPVYVLTRGGPENATLTLPIYIYQNAFLYSQPGYASALASLLFLLTLLLAGLLFFGVRRGFEFPGATL